MAWRRTMNMSVPFIDTEYISYSCQVILTDSYLPKRRKRYRDRYREICIKRVRNLKSLFDLFSSNYILIDRNKSQFQFSSYFIPFFP